MIATDSDGVAIGEYQFRAVLKDWFLLQFRRLSAAILQRKRRQSDQGDDKATLATKGPPSSYGQKKV